MLAESGLLNPNKKRTQIHVSRQRSDTFPIEKLSFAYCFNGLIDSAAFGIDRPRYEYVQKTNEGCFLQMVALDSDKPIFFLGTPVR